VQRSTIKDVAKRAKVSLKTVSRVINNEPAVQARTREKVLRAVEALEYRPGAPEAPVLLRTAVLARRHLLHELTGYYTF